jgi:dTDP-4-dehydrorhamnose reductase
MRLLVLGGTGQVGHELLGRLSDLGQVHAPSHAALDLADAGALRRTVVDLSPCVVVNAAAITDVDRCESRPALALRINTAAVAVIGEACRSTGGALIHLSTDYVFDGELGRPYVEDDATAPVNFYGASKLAAERVLGALEAPAIVLRTSWVFSTRRPCFVTRVLERARRDRVLRAPSRQVGSPTFCRDLAVAIAAIARRLAPDPASAIAALGGIYHAAGAGSASRLDLARAVVDLYPRREELVVEEVADGVSPPAPGAARRPGATPLDCAKLERVFGLRLPPWRDALARALAT